MTTYGHPSGASRWPADDGPDDGQDLRHQAVGATKDVAETAKEQAGHVMDEASRQARDLVGELKGSLKQQSEAQRDRAVSGLRTLSDELWDMGNHPDRPGGAAADQSSAGIASELARQGSSKTRELASYIETHDPGDIVQEVRDFARRRPGTFLLGAAILGIAVGRLTRGAVAAQSSNGSETERSPELLPVEYNQQTLPARTWAEGTRDEFTSVAPPTADAAAGKDPFGYPSSSGVPVERDLP